MKSITVDIIPDEFKQDKSVAPFIARSVELETVNPIVSYYCKIYVLEYIFNGKLHVNSKDAESFAVTLLENIEEIKNNEDDESLHKILNDKNLSFSVVLSFSYKLFNSCLQSLSNYKGYEKVSLAQKMRATLNFLQVLNVFTSNEEFNIDYAKLTGGKATTPSDFDKINKDKIKIIKLQLTKLIKDEIPIKDDELEHELNQELENISASTEEIEEDNQELSLPGVPETVPNGNNSEFINNSNDLGLPSAPSFNDRDDIPSNSELSDERNLGLPSAPSFENINTPSNPESTHENNNDLELSSTPSFDNDDTQPTSNGNDEVQLPGVPHFSPDDSNEVKLPGVPKFLPDDDISSINKSSSIQVFPPDSQSKLPTKPEVPKTEHKPINNNHEHITRESINAIIDKTDSIAKIQKHSKFAISALNYEDFKTAEAELTKALDLLKLVQQ